MGTDAETLVLPGTFTGILRGTLLGTLSKTCARPGTHLGSYPGTLTEISQAGEKSKCRQLV